MTCPTADLIPVLLGGDLNCYSVARAFHEAYGVVSHAFGRYPLGVTQRTRVVVFHEEPHMDDEETAVATLRAFAAAHPGRPLLLLGCTDDYAAFLIRCKARLSDLYCVPYTEAPLLDRLVEKADFYELCREYGIPYPLTQVVTEPLPAFALTGESLGFSYPIIVKPSSSIQYWKHPFPGMKKVYAASTPEEAASILRDIYGAGYPGRVILQDRIPGGDSHMRVLTAYSDRNCRVRMLSMGHVLLEEHTPKGLGNHAAIITEPPPAMAYRLRDMLNAIGYRGFSNFDLKYDSRDGQLKVFEINLRQGRSNHYVTAAGINVATLLVEDCLLEGEMPEREQTEPFFWHSVPKSVVYRCTEDDALVALARSLDKSGRSASPFFYKADLRGNPLRYAFVLEHLRRQFKKYKTYGRETPV